MATALASSFRFEVVTPKGTVLSAEAEECQIPGKLGSFGVLPGHTPFLTLIGTGEVMWRSGASRQYLAVSGGFCEVRPTHVTLLADEAERPEDIDATRTAAAKAKAEEHLKAVIFTGSGEQITEARELLAHEESRLKVATGKAGSGQAGTHPSGH